MLYTFIIDRSRLFIIVLCTLSINAIFAGNFLSENISTLYKDLPVLVTGGCGFIGSHVAEKLVELGANVTILDNLSTGTEDNIASFRNKVDFLYGDINDFETCVTATHNKNIIFHLAAFISVPASTENPQQCHDTNVMGTQNLLEAARMNGVKRFVFSSTCAVYSESLIPCNEQAVTDPISPYGFSKLIGELYCKEYAKVFNLETVVMRYFNVYGSRQNPQGHYAAVVAKFMHNMENNLPLTIFGDGMQTRDYVPVETVADANIVLGICNKDLIQSKIFNIATGKSSNLFDLIDALKEKYPSYTNNTIFMPPRPGDLKHVAADCSAYHGLYQTLRSEREKIDE
jgi:nucleoside-diphosphate-sugar epimerase